MNRPTLLTRGAFQYWTMMVYDTNGELVDADLLPVISVFKNGTLTADVVTITKRAATTGIYDCVYNPSGETMNDSYIIQESVVVGLTQYDQTWSFKVIEDIPQGFGAVSVDTGSGTIGADIQAIFSNALQPTSGQSSNMADRFTDFLDHFNANGRTSGNFNTVAPDNAKINTINTNVANTESVVDLIKSDTTALISGVSNLNDVTAAEVADAVWDEPTADHVAIGSTGERINLLDDSIGNVITDIAGLNDFDPATQTVTTDAASRTASQADVSALALESTLSSVAGVAADTNTRVQLVQATFPANFSTLIVGTGIDAGKVTTSNPAAGGGSAHTAEDVRDLILAGDKTPIAVTTGSVDNVILVDTTTDLTNGGSGGGATAAEVWAYVDANGVGTKSSQLAVTLAFGANIETTTDKLNDMLVLDGGFYQWTANALELAPVADVSALALESSVDIIGVVAADTNTKVSALNDFDPANDVVANVNLVNTTTNLTNSSGTNPADIYSYFTDASREDAFKADVSLLALDSSVDIVGVVAADTNTKVTALNVPTTQEIVDAWGNQPQGSYTTSGTLGYYLDAQVSSAGSGGSGLYQATVRVQDTSNDALQVARVNIDGTTLTLTTDSSGEVTFNLDSGVYLLEVSPPAGYDTPVGQTLTIGSSDPADTVFTLTSTSPPTGCDISWIG